MKVQAPGSQSLEGLLHKSNMSPDLKDIAALKHKMGGQWKKHEKNIDGPEECSKQAVHLHHIHFSKFELCWFLSWRHLEAWPSFCISKVHVGMHIKVKLLKEKKWKEQRRISLASPDSDPS